MASRKRKCYQGRPKDGTALLKQGRPEPHEWYLPRVLWRHIALDYARTSRDALALRASCKYILWSGIEPDDVRKAYWTDVISAAKFDDAELFRVVLAKNGITREADYLVKGGNSMTFALEAASSNGCLKVLRWMRDEWGYARTLLTTSGWLFWNKAAERGHVECARWLGAFVKEPVVGSIYDTYDPLAAALKGGSGELIWYPKLLPKWKLKYEHLKYAARGGDLNSIFAIRRIQFATSRDAGTVFLAAMKHGHMHVLEEWRLLSKVHQCLAKDAWSYVTSPGTAPIDSDMLCMTIVVGLCKTTNLDVVKWAVQRFDEVKWAKVELHLYGAEWASWRTSTASTECSSEILTTMAEKGAVDCIAFLMSHYGMRWGHDDMHRNCGVMMALIRSGLENDRPAVAAYLLSLPGAPNPPYALDKFCSMSPKTCMTTATWNSIMLNNALESARWVLGRCVVTDEIRRYLLGCVKSEEMFRLIAGEDGENTVYVVRNLVTFVHSNPSSAKYMRWWIKEYYGVDMNYNEKTRALTVPPSVEPLGVCK